MASVLVALRRSAQNSGQIYPIDNRGAWSPFIREPYAGAWQNNDGWCVDNVLAYPTVYACVNLISNDIAKLPPGVVAMSSNGIWVHRRDPAIDNLLANPNGFQNHIQFKQWWIMSKLIRGNTYVLKVRDSKGNIIGLFVLDPSRVQPLVAPDGSVWYQLGQDWLNHCELTSVTLPATEIIHDRMNCLFHPLVGVSPMFASGLAASQGLKIQNDTAKFFENGARPGGLLIAPGEISQSTADALKSKWDTNYSGVNSGKVAVIGDGLKFEPMRMNSVDSEVIAQLEWSDAAICATYNVPAYKVGVGPLPTNNNIEALTQEYYTQCLQIHIESMELCLDHGLELKPDTGIELDLDVLFRMDGITLFKMLGEGVKGTILAPNEARKRVNLPPVKGGESPMSQQQNYSLEALAKRDALADPFATGGSAPPPPAPADPDEDEEPAEVDEEKGISLDGAQIVALRGIIAAVQDGQMPKETAQWVIKASFPMIPPTSVEAMLQPLTLAPAPVEPEEDNGDLLKLLPLFLREELLCEI